MVDPEFTKFDDIVTIIGFGKVHWCILCTCGCFLMMIANETMGMAIISAGSECDLEMTSSDKSLLKSAIFLGLISTFFFWGYFIDLMGRRKILLFSVSMTILFSVLSMFMTTYWPFFTLRFFTGVFMTAPSIASLVYLSEFCMEKYRSVIISCMFMFNGFSMLYCPGLAVWLANQKWRYPIYGKLEYCSWRLIGFLYTLPGIVGVLMLLRLPESPKFFLSLNKEKEAYAVLEKVCQQNKQKSLKEDFQIFGVEPLLMREETSEKRWWILIWGESAPLFRPPYVSRFVGICLINFCLFSIANGMAIWFTEFRNREIENVENATLCNTITTWLPEDLKPQEFVCIDRVMGFNDSLLLGGIIILFYIMLTSMLLYVPRKIVFITPLIISGICGVSLTWIKHGDIIRIIFILFIAFPNVVLSLLGGTLVEFIPTYLRGKAFCICVIIGRVGAVSTTNLIGNYVETDCVTVFNIISSLSFFAVLLAAMLPLNEKFF